MNAETLGLIERYHKERKQLTSYQLAKLESDIWNALKPTRSNLYNKKGKRYQLGEYFAEVFGVSRHDAQRRLALYLQGEWVEELWQEMDKGIAANTAERIMRMARDSAEDSSPEAKRQSLSIVLKRYKRTKKILPEKKSKAKQEVSPPSEQPANSPSEQPASPNGQPKDEETLRKWQVSRQFTLDLETLVNKYLDDLIGDNIPLRDKARLQEDFINFVGIATDDFRREVRKCERLAKEEIERKRKIGKKRLDYACEVLGIRCKFGQPPDGGWDNARVVFARRVEPLHPDKGHNNPAMVEEYQRVVEAYDMVKEYRSQLESSVR